MSHPTESTVERAEVSARRWSPRQTLSGLNRPEQRKTRMESQTMNVGAAAKKLGISPGSAWKAVHRGELPAIRIGRRVLVPVRALERLLETGAKKEKED